MDGLRKVPDNVPNGDMLAAHLEKPLTSVPDPFGTHDSFAARIIMPGCKPFSTVSALTMSLSAPRRNIKAVRLMTRCLPCWPIMTKCWTLFCRHWVRNGAKPIRRFCPYALTTGRVLMVPVSVIDAAAGRIAYPHPETGETVETLVTGGACKLQWKADWAMRWTALGVDYEMAGKDLSESVKLSSRIARALGATPPEGFSYELFLDENGEKISKSRGNGLTIEEWLAYAPQESLSLYMFQNPRKGQTALFRCHPESGG